MSVGNGAASRWGLRVLGLGYILLLLLLPLGLIFYKTFENGIAPPLDAITSPDGLNALKLTLLMVAIAVPLRTKHEILGVLLLGARHDGSSYTAATKELLRGTADLLALTLIVSPGAGKRGTRTVRSAFRLPTTTIASLIAFALAATSSCRPSQS